MFRFALGLAALLLSCGASPARANDSVASLNIGGLALLRSEAIRLDRQELFISRERVRVEYLFTNLTGRDIETLVAFPPAGLHPQPGRACARLCGAARFPHLGGGPPGDL